LTARRARLRLAINQTALDHNLKLKLIVLTDDTGLPSRVEGLNFQRLAAETAASLNSAGPDIARAETTSPFSLIVTSTVTMPL
jgi:hypothetical protein